MGTYLGIDIGGTAAKLGLVNEEGQVLASESYGVSFDDYQTPILQTVLKSSQDFLQMQKISPETLCAIGISATGQIDTQQGVVIGSAGHIQNWLGSPLKQAFIEAYGKPVNVINDANSVALGESWVGAARGKRHVVAVTIGTGVGGGVIVDGKLLSGRTGIAGELGHLILSRDGETCSCGNRGCLERYASMSALVRRVQNALPLPGVEDVLPEQIDGKRIFQWMWNGNTAVEAIVDEWIGCIADGLIGLIHIFNPEVILLGGGVSKEGERFLRLVRQKVLAGAMPRFTDDLEIKATALGNDAGLVGAVRSCLC